MLSNEWRSFDSFAQHRGHPLIAPSVSLSLSFSVSPSLPLLTSKHALARGALVCRLGRECGRRRQRACCASEADVPML